MAAIERARPWFRRPWFRRCLALVIGLVGAPLLLSLGELSVSGRVSVNPVVLIGGPPIGLILAVALGGFRRAGPVSWLWALVAHCLLWCSLLVLDSFIPRAVPPPVPSVTVVAHTLWILAVLVFGEWGLLVWVARALGPSGGEGSAKSRARLQGRGGSPTDASADYVPPRLDRRVSPAG